MFALRSWHILFVLTVLPVGFLAKPCRAGEPSAADPIQATTELGVTINPSDLFDAFDESCRFWPAVRRHIAGPDFKAGDASLRAEADTHIKRMQDQLHHRLMQGSETGAADLIDFATWNLRRTAVYRELRDVIGDGAALVQLRLSWQHNFRKLVDANQPLTTEAMVAGVTTELQHLGLPEDRFVKAMELWNSIAICTARAEATETARMIRDYDRLLGDTPAAGLTREIVTAADWASVIKPNDGTLGREHFINAWNELHHPPVGTTAAVGGGQ